MLPFGREGGAEVAALSLPVTVGAGALVGVGALVGAGALRAAAASALSDTGVGGRFLAATRQLVKNICSHNAGAYLNSQLPVVLVLLRTTGASSDSETGRRFFPDRAGECPTAESLRWAQLDAHPHLGEQPAVAST